MSEERDCVVKLADDHGVEHSVRVRAESVYKAALKGLKKLERVGWESDGSQIGLVTVGVWEEPTINRINVAKMLRWVKVPGRRPRGLAGTHSQRRFVSRRAWGASLRRAGRWRGQRGAGGQASA